MNLADRARTRESAPVRERLNVTVVPRGMAIALPVFLFLTALFVFYRYDPLYRSVSDDPAIFVYISKLAAQGIPPHLGAFNEQSSLTFLAGGAAMWLGEHWRVPDLMSYRLLSLLVASSVVVLTYAVGARFARSRAVGLVAGLMMLGMRGYGFRAADVLEPKSLMLLGGLSALYLLSRHRWFWAGVFAGAAGLAWQIGWIYALVALVLALAQGGKARGARLRAAGAMAAGFAIALGLYMLYFIFNGALVPMIQQTFIAPFLLHSIAGESLPLRLQRLARTFMGGYGGQLLFGLLGAAGWVTLLAIYLRTRRRAAYFFLKNRRTAGVMLASLGFLLYSFVDFQNYPDWIPILPFISIFAAWFLVALWSYLSTRLNFSQRASWATLALIVGVVFVASTASAWRTLGVDYSVRTDNWRDQAKAAVALDRQLPRDASVWVLGKPELLFFSGRSNLNRYIYLFGDADAAVEAFEPGGFRGMVERARGAQPVLLVLARFNESDLANPANYKMIEQWAQNDFIKLKVCDDLGKGDFYVRTDQADALFPAQTSNGAKAPCVSR